MISSAKVNKLFAYLVPHLRGKTDSELNAIHSDLRKILGYDPAKVARYRKDARDRDTVMESLQMVSFGGDA